MDGGCSPPPPCRWTGPTSVKQTQGHFQRTQVEPKNPGTNEIFLFAYFRVKKERTWSGHTGEEPFPREKIIPGKVRAKSWEEGRCDIMVEGGQSAQEKLTGIATGTEDKLYIVNWCVIRQGIDSIPFLCKKKRSYVPYVSIIRKLPNFNGLPITILFRCTLCIVKAFENS